MKKFIPLVFMVLTFKTYSQQHACAINKQNSSVTSVNLQSQFAALSPQLVHEANYDVKFVHLNLNLERTNKFISGGVKTVAKVSIAALDTFQTLLHLNHSIDSIRFNGQLVSAIRVDSIVKFKTPQTLSLNASFTVQVYYHGTAPTGGSAIGSGFSTGTSGSWGNQATWSLSESFVAYHWWPCKQMLTDKIDSSWVFVTTDSTNKVGSNGLLKNVVVVGTKKRYEWKSKTPIDYYLISVAVARYKEYNLYAKPQYLVNDSILIQNYIYDGAFNNTNWITSQKVELNKMPAVMKFLCNMYGMYPFYKEKYGHCMAPFGGGMEHQTMTSLGYFDYYVDAHELGHQWWGDNVTCKSWGDIWINEGFASYTEHLVAQYLDSPNFASNLNAAHVSVMSQLGGSCFFTDTLNTTRIFSSRLTYDKGGAIIHSLRFLTNNDSLWFNCLRGFQTTYKNNTASVVNFKNYYQNFTGINPTQFFTQWFYGEGYPTFNVSYNYTGTNCIIKSIQSVSVPSITPLFITPMEYRISRVAKADTVVRVMHSNATEIYTIALTGTVTSMGCDPNNWIINKVIGPVRDATMGITSPPPINDVSISEQTSFETISIGPNPCKTTISINSAAALNGIVSVWNIEGKQMLEKHFDKSTELDFTHYAAGVYLIKLYDVQGNERRSEKIIKQ